MLNDGSYTLVDDEDYEFLSQFQWYKGQRGYAIARVTMHRLVRKTPKDKLTDHINGNKLDNRKSNLRICSAAQNLTNRPPDKTNISGFKGVSWSKKRNTWETTIKVKGRKSWIGYFSNPRHAAMAYDIWAKELHGEFAWLNFPLESDW